VGFEEQYRDLTREITAAREARGKWLERFKAELEFASAFAEAFPDKTEVWRKLILKAAESVKQDIEAGQTAHSAVEKGEEILAPIGKVARKYTIHCCGHAHIDMNWMWGWPETVNISHDTFVTVDKLMDEFPEFHFSQSQTSVYAAMEKYCPEVFEMIKKRVAEGRWEVTASHWVEGDKNMFSGESLCRHLLYTRKYFRDKFGLKPEDVKMDWSPDTFGHAHNVPSIVSKGGVSRYYHVRTGPGPTLYKWRSPDGSEITVFNDPDKAYGYNGPISPPMAMLLPAFVKETGLKDFLAMYGVGDHGGGPTRKDLRTALALNEYPIMPVYKLSTTDAFFTAVEQANPDLPVVDKDLNFIFEGCYTSQSGIKYANRISEIALPEAETLALTAGALSGMEYPAEMLEEGWRKTLFNHFHDILPGSGVRATAHYAQGNFQETMAAVSSVKTRALRRLASSVNTVAAVGVSSLGRGLGDGLGGGAGDAGVTKSGFKVGESVFTNTLDTSNVATTIRSMGSADAEPILVYNAKPWKRSEMVMTKVWNKPLEAEKVIVRDSDGNTVKGQIVDQGHYWGHDYSAVVFPAVDVPAMGYKVFAVDESVVPLAAEGGKVSDVAWGIYGENYVRPGGRGTIENELLKVEVDFASGAVSAIIDKETGYNFVPEGKLLGLLEVHQENPHGMTAWVIGHAPTVTQLTQGGKMNVIAKGPNRGIVRVDHKYSSSDISVEIGLDAGAREIDFKVRTRWTEIGTPQTGVPMLKAAFPLNCKNGVPTYEIPFGSQTREQGAQEIPALKWADLTGSTDKGVHGITLVNGSKNGHSCVDNTLRLTLLRSSYDPDPIPEVGDHEIAFAVRAHQGPLDVTSATRAGEAFGSPLVPVSATVQEGTLPAEMSFVEVLTPGVFVSSVKKAEDSDAVVIRVFETLGVDTKGKIALNGIVGEDREAVECDILERPLEKNTAKLKDGVLTVTVPAYSNVTVMLR
jgi:alpha-mannosidase